MIFFYKVNCFVWCCLPGRFRAKGIISYKKEQGRKEATGKEKRGGDASGFSPLSTLPFNPQPEFS